MERRVFFENSVAFVPEYDRHTSVTGQERYRKGLELLESLLGKHRYVFVFGAELSYKEGCSVDLDRLQKDVRAWLTYIKRRDGQGVIKGAMVQLEQGTREGKLHAHVLLYTTIDRRFYWEYVDLFTMSWSYITYEDGYYYNQNPASDESDKQYQGGSLGFVHSDDHGRIYQTCMKIGYNTKDEQRPLEAKVGKRKCFICEEYE